jgi:hypothetical protein
MSEEQGLWIATGGRHSADKFIARIEQREHFTKVVSASEIRPKVAELALVSVELGEINYLAISQAGTLVATDDKSIGVSNFVDLGSLPIDEIRAGLPKEYASRFGFPNDGVSRPTAKMWAAVLDIVLKARPNAQSSMKKLRGLIQEARAGKQQMYGGVEVFERDAVATALEVFGGQSFRKRVLRSASPASDVATTAPFLTRLKEVPLREDPQIVHDQMTFPGMEVAVKHQVDAVVLVNRDERLTIINCNRQPLEKTLGVDLIYYNHRFDSFVLVQYKRMNEEAGGKVSYRPKSDKNHEPEMKRMDEADKLLDSLPAVASEKVDDFRLTGQPFFMKLCEPKTKVALDSGMVAGMYLPLALWKRLLKSDDVIGAKGGIAVTWENCSRRFNNGEFTSLLRSGWIGSSAGQSKKLSEIIEAVLGSGRMLVLAATGDSISSPDFKRDERGRFASEDDPLSST